MQRQYWKFYWPLSLMGLAMVLSRQFQNAALARFDDPRRELAVWAMAASTFFLFNAALVFVPQMVNVLARSTRARRVCLRFTAAICMSLSAPPAMLAFTAAGREIIGRFFNIAGGELDDVTGYLRLLLPLIMVNGLRQYYTGLLIQARRTGAATVMHAAATAVVGATLFAGVTLHWRVVSTVVLSQVVSSTLHLLATFVLYKRFFRPPDRPSHDDLTYGRAMAFFWPVAATSTMFSLTRPIIYSFVNRTDAGQSRIAALRVAFDLAMLFHAPMNQMRNLMVTFGAGDLAGLRRFMTRITLAATAMMLAIAVTPLGRIVLEDMLGVEGGVLTMARQALYVLCGIPLIVSLRNYFHGGAMIVQRTRSMAVGAVGRIGAVYLATWATFSVGLLQHTAAAAILLLGFAVEGAIVAMARPLAHLAAKPGLDAAK